ncbi:PQQ-dependent sugar dehydrogenase [Fictibacillus phosphorivorans]|uniref:PQQ-dependent sugar dehydrogenase n=1 Tax=Fictibacillus phosphorivorans TaxID=1221500 RepID=UPI00203AEB92|nr:PQQ-dependent sugar dehydrogenase [Fictibacillus phosphorivorans]MCM3719541.1 PQQ-dependent sugar dehydrogenase [Fictibacillus phosphorivorans]MCM3777232.1 PQQ-dependent sugar dehydrogenase [Fictibacillus phosphorivorans]
MKKVKVRLRPIVSGINLPTVLKTTRLPGDSIERLFIATQVGEVLYIGNGEIRTFLDIRSNVIKLNGYDERGLLGLAFHPGFYYNGLFYLHYSVKGTQGPGALQGPFDPNPCDSKTLNLRWINRETQYDHIDTVEEWILQPNGPQKRRTLLNLRRPFSNHNGVNSLNFSPESGKLVLTTGDGGSGYDPFNLSQDNMEIAGKIIEIDVSMNTFINDPPVVTRFNELPVAIQETLTVIAKGVRNISGISFQRFNQQFIKYIGNVGQNFEETIFSFVRYQPIPVTHLIQATLMNANPIHEAFINFGWRGWEGAFPTLIMRGCTNDSSLNENIVAYTSEAIQTSVDRLPPLTTYFHKDSRPGKFSGTALTGVKPYMGYEIPDLTGSVVFIDLIRNEPQPPARGVLAYTRLRIDGKLNDYSIIDIDYPFGSQSAYFMSLGSNLDQTRLYLGVYGSMRVSDPNQGTVFEIVP